MLMQDFTVSNNSSIDILPDYATLNLYVDGNILFDNVSNINGGANT